jgi:WhiB family redox-sensing transcriptional regulator
MLSTLRSDDLWQADAACRGPHAGVFFPPSYVEAADDRAERERRAKAICAGCPVRQPCLRYALESGEPYGIWGGLNELERASSASSSAF